MQGDSALPPVSASAVAIAVDPVHPRVWFPASEADIRHVLDRVPPGTLDGLSSVRLRAGTMYVNFHGPENCHDPYLHRRSWQWWPGVWLPQIGGTYNMEKRAIEIFGYVLAPDVRLSPEQRAELRFTMLRTLAHELAHHDDRSRRVARGRWRMDNVDRYERYAESMTLVWIYEIVIPYLAGVPFPLPVRR